MRQAWIDFRTPVSTHNEARASESCLAAGARGGRGGSGPGGAATVNVAALAQTRSPRLWKDLASSTDCPTQRLNLPRACTVAGGHVARRQPIPLGPQPQDSRKGDPLGGACCLAGQSRASLSRPALTRAAPDPRHLDHRMHRLVAASVSAGLPARRTARRRRRAARSARSRSPRQGRVDSRCSAAPLQCGCQGPHANSGWHAAQEGETYAALYIRLLNKLSRNDTLQFILVLLGDFIAGPSLLCLPFPRSPSHVEHICRRPR